MIQTILRETLSVDESHQIHITIPVEMGTKVEIVVLPCSETVKPMSDESLMMAKIMDDTGFAKEVLNSPEEDCWNDL